MSKERKLLLEWIRRYVALMALNDSYRESISLDDVYGETLSLLAQPEQEPLSDEVLYHDRLRKKVEMMKKEWVEYNLTDNLINDFFACARKELADEGVYDREEAQGLHGKME